MRVIIVYIILGVLFGSCGSGIYFGVHDQTQFERNETEILSVSIDIDEFDIYVFNFCEDRSQNYGKDRFQPCPFDFYNLDSADMRVKIEETYILIHESNDLVLYFPTFSHKYINWKSGFLNDRKIYENSVIVNEFDKIYIGSIDRSKKLISFYKQEVKNGEKKIHELGLTYKGDLNSNIIIESVLAPTVENKYKTKVPIALEGVFSLDLNFELKDKYKLYHDRTRSHCGKPKFEKLIVGIVDDELNIVFEYEGYSSKMHYRFENKRIEYHPSYAEIVELIE